MYNFEEILERVRERKGERERKESLYEDVAIRYPRRTDEAIT